MLEIFLFSGISSVQILITGYLFCYFFFNKGINAQENIFELGFFGLLLLSFIAILLNFFMSLSQRLNDIIFILPFIIFFLFFFNKTILKKIIIYSAVVATFFLLTVSFDTVNRPDAGLYHLPYVSVLNENKIIIGINNLHFRFGHTSIMQYVSALYNNHLFSDNGILIPLGLIYCYAIGYLVFEILNNKNKELIIFIFTIFAFSIFTMNRYGEFGNDAPAHFLFFYLICEALKNNNIIYKIKKTSLIATFVFLNKVTLIFCFLIPLYFFIKKFRNDIIFNKSNNFCLFFLLLFFLKNFLVSGCLIFPAEQTCVKKIFWYDYNSQRNSNAINARLENEAWAKGWVDQQQLKKDFKHYISDYEWVGTWKNNHGKIIIKRVTPFLIFMIFIICFLLIYQFKKKDYKKFKNNFLVERYFFLLICVLGSIFWFMKFPVFRYGYSYLASTFGLFLLIISGNFNFFQNLFKFKKVIIFFLTLMILTISVKNIIRIFPKITNMNNYQNAWPNIYSDDLHSIKKENIPLYKNGQFLFYKSKIGTCYYSSSPCTHYFNKTDFTLSEINFKIFKGYKFFYFKKMI